VNGEKDVDDIRTLMEEVDMRIKETKQETYEFKRDVILGEYARHAPSLHACHMGRALAEPADGVRPGSLSAQAGVHTSLGDDQQ
jgi:hypothetical protein